MWKRYKIFLKEGYWLNGEPYYPDFAIAEWLELDINKIDEILKKSPYIKQFMKIYKNDEDDKIRIFTMEGVQLFAMQINTIKSIEFKIAAARFFVQGIDWGSGKTSKLDSKNIPNMIIRMKKLIFMIISIIFGISCTADPVALNPSSCFNNIYFHVFLIIASFLMMVLLYIIIILRKDIKKYLIRGWKSNKKS